MSRLAIVAAIVRKDLVEWSRDWFWAAISVMVLVAFAILFWVLPETVEETLYVGVAPAALAQTLAEASAADRTTGGEPSDASGIRVAGFDSEEALVEAIDRGRVVEIDGETRKVLIGIVFPGDLPERLLTGRGAAVRVYVDASVPEEVTSAMAALVRELAYGAQALTSGRHPDEAFPVVFPRQETMILGEDRAGDQVPFKEQMRPMLAFTVVLMESLALAALIAVEIQSKTVTALLVTPARVSDVLVAKSLTGTLLAFTQVLLLLLLTQAFAGSNVGALLLAALLGSVMATAVGMLTGAAGRDFMGTLSYGLFFLIPMIIPAFAVLLPGSASWVVRVIPSWGVIHPLAGATAYGLSWGEMAVPLACAGAWCSVLYLAGWVQLRRKLQTL